MKLILETSRLFLREFEKTDAVHFLQMNNDPEVIRYTGDPSFTSLMAAQKFIENYNAYKETGMGRYAVIRKSDNAFLGWCGLKYHPKEDVVDIGYRFYQSYWGQGYATESARATITYAFRTLNYPFLVAHAHVDNVASHKVIKKCGMHFVKHITYDGLPAILYQIDNKNKIHV